MKNLAELAEREAKKQQSSARRRLTVTILIGIAVLGVAALAVIGITHSVIDKYDDHFVDPAKPMMTIDMDEPIEGTYVEHDMVHYRLINGYYMIGRDIPAGVYEIEAESGHFGYVYTDDYSFHQLMSSPDKYYDEDYAVTVRNAELKEGTILSVDSVTLIVSTDYSKTDTPLEYPISDNQTLNLLAGEYTVGKDFPEGSYNVRCIAGNGVLQIGTEEDTNREYISLSAPADDWNTDCMANISFYDGDKVTIRYLSLELTPSSKLDLRVDENGNSFAPVELNSQTTSSEEPIIEPSAVPGEEPISSETSN